jgi:outer membrane protein OmpA-like peptidoglycan-associated protein
MRLIKTLLSALLAFYCQSTQASFKTYEAPLDESNWYFDGNLLACSLNHTIPMYGKASFNKRAGKKQDLVFNLSYRKQPISAVKVASVQSLSPSWLPRQRSRTLGEIPILNGSNIFSTKNTATWKLLNELEVGRFPTFSYQDFESIEDQVAVSLSAVGFKKPYDKFLDCLSTLVPYRLEELTKMTLRFDFDQHKIRSQYKEKLKALAAYVRYDPNLEVVVINGYTDSKGSRGYNDKLAQRRIDSVQKLLTLEGANLSRIKTLAFGEKDPVASNRKPSGRALNRRVYIKVSHVQ